MFVSTALKALPTMACCCQAHGCFRCSRDNGRDWWHRPPANIKCNVVAAAYYLSTTSMLPFSLNSCFILSFSFRFLLFYFLFPFLFPIDTAFKECRALTEISLPKGLLSIGWGAFSNCEKLPKVDIPVTCKKIAEFAFFECIAVASVTIPGTLKIVPENGFQGCTSLKTVTIANGTQCIGSGAFADCANLATITIIGSGLRTIGVRAAYSRVRCIRIVLSE